MFKFAIFRVAKMDNGKGHNLNKFCQNELLHDFDIPPCKPAPLA